MHVVTTAVYEKPLHFTQAISVALDGWTVNKEDRGAKFPFSQIHYLYAHKD
jgi:hypothetical protein